MSTTELKKPEFIQVKDLDKARSGYNVYVKVVKVDSEDHQYSDGKTVRFAKATLSDETGSVQGFFKGETALLITKDVVIAIRNGVKRFNKGHICLEIDPFGRVTTEKLEIKVNEEVNISEKFYEKPSFQKGGQRGPPRGRNQNFQRRGRNNSYRRPQNDRQQNDRPYNRNNRNQPREEKEELSAE